MDVALLLLDMRTESFRAKQADWAPRFLLPCAGAGHIAYCKAVGALVLPKEKVLAAAAVPVEER